ncbi:porimin [Ascaphus truei]|uniref:porimin n=1 Tax=Ascaphus truei TaxID=8439 RepID=UPI003F5A1928
MRVSGFVRARPELALLVLLAASCASDHSDSHGVQSTTDSTGNTATIPSSAAASNETTFNTTMSPSNLTTIPITVTNMSTTASSTILATTSVPGTPVTNSSSSTTDKVSDKTTAAVSTSSIAGTSSMASAALIKISGFDLGSFIGGIVLALGLLAVLYFGCKFYNSKRGVRYRTIDEHEAII